MYGIEFTEDAATFRERALDFLSARPVTTSVVATTIARAIAEREQGIVRDPERPWWFATVHQPTPDADHDGDGEVIGIAMRTAPMREPMIWVNEMPDDAAVQLAQRLYDRGELIPGVNGSLPAAQVFADETARIAGAQVGIGMHSRLFELGTAVPPTGVPGRLRTAVEDEAELLFGWRSRFHTEATEQAGRDPDSERFEVDLDDTRRRIDSGTLWVWENEGEVVHFTGASLPAFGVSRIGPVFTPREHRGCGYAGAAVAGISSRLVEQGARVCLFTDQANPVSNDLYQRIGFRPVVDMANFTIS